MRIKLLSCIFWVYNIDNWKVCDLDVGGAMEFVLMFVSMERFIRRMSVLMLVAIHLVIMMVVVMRTFFMIRVSDCLLGPLKN